MDLKPGFIRMLQNDYFTLVSFALALPVPLILIIAGQILSAAGLRSFRWDQPPGIIFVSATALVGVSFLAWRLWLVYNTFANGVEVPGIIIKVDPHRVFVDVEFEYTVNNLPIKGKCSLVGTAPNQRICPGDRVPLVVHADCPERAFIRDLYI